MKKISAIILAFIMLFTCAFAEDIFVAGNQTTEERAPLPDALHVGSFTKVSGLFFTNLFGTNTSDIDVRNMLHDLSTITWTSEAEYAANPTVVKELRSNENGDGSKTFFIILNEGMKFSDGSEITAADYVFSVLFEASHQMKEIGAAETAYTYLKGYEEYHNGKTNIFTGVRLLGTYVFSLTVDEAYLPFFYETSYAMVKPYPINAILGNFEVGDTGDGAYIRAMDVTQTEIGEEGTIETAAPEFTSALLERKLFSEGGYVTNPKVVSGPYTLVKYDADTGCVEFAINPYYPGNANGDVPTIEKVTFEHADADTAIEELENGRFNLLNKCVSAQVINSGMDSDAHFSNYARRGLGYIAMACEGEILSDANVRKAIARAIDKQAFLNDLVGEYGMEVYGYYGIGQWMTQAAIGAIKLNDLTPEQQAAWDEVKIEELNKNPFDLDSAVKLLEDAGWNKASDGSAYESGIRYKELDGKLTKLAFVYGVAEESTAGNMLIDYLTSALEAIGAELTVETMSFNDCLEQLYTPGDRACDLYFLGSNFDIVFDPSTTFATADEFETVANITHIKDAELEKLAIDMRCTEPEDTVGYLTSWYEFQLRFADVMPLVPLYSDTYVDFYVETLQNYDIYGNESWANAIVAAHFDYADEDTLDENTPENDLFVD